MSTERKWIGKRDNHNAYVLSLEDNITRVLPLYLNEVNHSPTGFEWGYYGSGPSQLAYAILRSYFGEREKAEELYTQFKSDFIAVLPSSTSDRAFCDWVITESQVKEWLERNNYA